MPSRTSSLIAARSGTRHIDLVAKADDVGERADQAIHRAWVELVRLLEKPPQYIFLRQQIRAILQRIQAAAHAELQRGLTALAYQGHKDAAGVLAQTLPLDTLASRITLREDKEPARKAGLRFRVQAGQLKVEPAIGGSTAHKRRLMKQLLFEPPSKEKVAEILRRPVLGLNWEQDLSAASRLAGFDPDRMTHLLTTGFALGHNVQQLAKDILPSVEGVRSSARRIARTYGVQVARALQFESHQALGDLVIGYQINATLDQNTRPEHRKRDGTIYYRTPEPGQKGFDEMPRPPLEADGKMAWNCRCFLSPILSDEDAAIPKTDEGKLIPDMGVFADWFAQADERRRKLAVGVRRYEAGRGFEGRPDWENFVDPDTGELLSPAELEAETAGERAQRVGRVRGMLVQTEETSQFQPASQ